MRGKRWSVPQKAMHWDPDPCSSKKQFALKLNDLELCWDLVLHRHALCRYQMQGLGVLGLVRSEHGSDEPVENCHAGVSVWRRCK